MGRAVIAWIVSALAASSVVVVGAFIAAADSIPVEEAALSYFSALLPVALYAVLLGALASAALIWLVRLFGAPRPIGDVSAACAVCIGAPIVAYLGLAGAEGIAGFVGSLGWPLFAGGVAGGLAYWLLAGMPRPPYEGSSGQPASRPPANRATCE